MPYKENRAETELAFERFWAGDFIGRPLLAVTAPRCKDVKCVPYMAGAKEKDYDKVFRDFHTYAKNIYWAGESMPAFECTFGPDQFAAFFGGKITYGNYGTSWIEPFLREMDQPMELDLRDDGYLAEMCRFIEKGVQSSQGEFLINMLDLHSNIDALSAARGPQNFMLDLYDAPEAVLKQTERINQGYKKVFEAVSNAGKMQQNGYYGWAPTYSKEKFSVVQCDASCMMGREMFRKFALPSIEFEVSQLKHCVYHYDGKEALGHLDDILAIPGIDVIQWVPGAGQPRTLEWMDLLKKIQSAGKGLWIYDWTADEIIAKCKELKPEKLIFSLTVETPEEADRLIQSVEKLYR